ncbi:MAG: hypothetical protein AB1626_05205 [Candidatus Micrarchaeota archaeon]
MPLESVLAKRVSELSQAFAKHDIIALKQLGGDAAEDAFAADAPCLVDVSIVAYSLAKFLEKPYIVASADWKDFEQTASQSLSQALAEASAAKPGEACRGLHSLLQAIEELSRRLGRFTTGVVEKARVKAATQVYAHGASLGKAVELTGANKQELSRYIGVTRLSEKYQTLGVRKRLSVAQELFK